VEGKHISVKLENQQALENIEELCLWVKGLRIDVKNDVIASWNKKTLCFHHLRGQKAGKLIFSLKDIIPIEYDITDLVINMDYRYFYNSTSSGEINVWKFDSSKK